MTHATVRAKSPSLPKSTPHPDVEIIELAALFEAAWDVERALKKDDTRTDEELEAANARTEKIVEKIVARASSNPLMPKLKARAYLWAESWDLEELSPARDMVSDPIIVSLFHDLGADVPVEASPDEGNGAASSQR
jgi:hypothetical protein